MKAYYEKKNESLQERDMLNHVLGKYIAYANNNPKKYPKSPYLGYVFESEKKVNGIMSNDEMEKIAKRNNIILGGKTNDN